VSAPSARVPVTCERFRIRVYGAQRLGNEGENPYRVLLYFFSSRVHCRQLDSPDRLVRAVIRFPYTRAFRDKHSNIEK